MSKSKTLSLQVSKPFFLIFLVALLLGVLYLASFLRQLQKLPGEKSNLIAAVVDFEKETGEYDSTVKTGEFLKQKVDVPAKQSEQGRQVLGDTSGDKRIEVDLSAQRLYAFEGDRKVFDFLISSGKWGRTPTGTFTIWSKFRFTKMSGGSKALGTYYYLPNVPYVMFFSNAQVAGSRGFSLHGTYWHNNFGHPMSHGCVNMKTEEAEQIYYWSAPTLPEGQKSGRATRDNPGTTIVIYGEAPPS